MAKPPFNCDRTIASHEQLTAPQLRTHYNNGCRDDLTRAAKSGKQSPEVSRTVEVVPASTAVALSAPRPTPPALAATVRALGTSRRLRGLVRIGFTPAQLAEHLSLNESTVWLLLFWPPETVKTTTHTLVATVFKRLRDQPQLHGGRNADHYKLMAETYAWLPPYSWKDIDTDAAPTTPVRIQSTGTAEIDMLREKLATAQKTITNISAPDAATTPPTCDHTAVLEANAELNLALVDKDAQLREAQRIADDLSERIAHRAEADEAAAAEAITATFAPLQAASRHRAATEEEPYLRLEFAPRPDGGFSVAIPTTVLDPTR